MVVSWTSTQGYALHKPLAFFLNRFSTPQRSSQIGFSGVVLHGILSLDLVVLFFGGVFFHILMRPRFQKMHPKQIMFLFFADFFFGPLPFSSYFFKGK